MLSRVASRFDLPGEPYRLRVVHALKRGAMSVGELVRSLDGNQPNVSRHLQLLYHAHLVSRQREGRRIIHSVTDPTEFTLFELARQKRTDSQFK